MRILPGTAGHLGGALHHDPAPDQVVLVGQSIREPLARRVQQQARRLDRVAGDGHGLGGLEALPPVVEVGDAAAAPRPVGLDPRDHAVRANLHPVLERIGDVGDERRRLRADLAALRQKPR